MPYSFFYVILNICRTSHGKGSWDGIGSLVKKHARQVITNRAIGCPIRSPETFYEETKKYFKNMEVFYVSEAQIRDISLKKDLKSRFERSKTIPGTQRMHHFSSIQGNPNQLRTKPVSNLPDSFYKTYNVG